MLRRFVIRMLIAAVVLVLAGAATGCVSTADREADRSLDAVERLLRADSAAQAAEAIARVDTAAISSRAVAARYAMLHAYTRYKNYIDDTAMIYLAPALDYYCGPSPKGPDRYRALTLFLKGKYHKAARRNADAIEAFLDADDSLVDPNEFLLRGFIRQSIADCYKATFNGHEQLKYSLLAQDAFRHSTDSDYIAWGWRDIAQAYQNTFDFPNAIAYADSAITYAKPHNRIQLEADCHRIKANSFSSIKSKAAAVEEYSEVVRLDPSALNIYDKVFLQNNAYCAKDSIKNLRIVNDFLSHLGGNDLKSHHVLFLQGDYREAYNQLYAIDDSLSRKFQNSIREEVSSRAVESRELKIALKDRELSANRQLMIFLAVVALLVAAISFFVFKYRVARHKAREAELILQARRLVEESDALKLIIDKKEGFITSSTRALSTLLECYEDCQNSELVEQINGHIDGILRAISTPEYLDMIETQVNMQSGGLISKVRGGLRRLKEKDAKMMALIAAGFSNRTIARVLSIEADKVYRRKYKLRDRLINAGLDAEATILFVEKRTKRP